MGAIESILQAVAIPPMAQVTQLFDGEKIDDIPAALRAQLNRPEIAGSLHPGMRVAITAGSRGISGYQEILRGIVSFVKEMGADPFIIPAMGSHGGASASGQLRILESLGITEDTVGAPIRATMEVSHLADLPDGTPVYIDKFAYEADGIIVVNRIKPHTSFHGTIESGLHKMMAVGLGKQYGADIIHDRGTPNMPETIPLFGQCILEHANILFGVGTVENAYDQLCILEAISPKDIPAREPELLKLAKAKMARVYFENLDILLVDQVGKDISGAGMDPNITHTYPEDSAEPRTGRAIRVVVFDLSQRTHGNPLGLGGADITTTRAINKVDRQEGYPNMLTIGLPIRMPMYFDSQKQAIQAAIKTLPVTRRDNPRIVRIRDTLHLSQIQISQALLEEARQHPLVRVEKEPQPLSFDREDNLF